MANNIVTYDSIREYVKGCLNRDDPRVDEQIDNFIMLGERVTSQVLEIEGLKKFITGETLVGNGLLAKPDRWLNSFSFGIYVEDSNGQLLYRKLISRTLTYCLEYWPYINLFLPESISTMVGTPSQYSDVEYNQLLMVPTPQESYKYLWGYWEVPELLSDNVNTNFLTEHDPQCLMYAAVMEANYFLQNYQEGDAWRDRFFDSLSKTKDVDKRLIADGAQRRDHM